MALSGSLYSMEFDPATVARIGALSSAHASFILYYLSAMRYSVNTVMQQAILNAPVGVYPPSSHRLGGNLRRGIRVGVVTPWVGEVGVLKNVPYARRRELGFDNRIDRLGRKYARDPRDDTGKRANMFYLRRAMESSTPAIASAFRTSVQMATRGMAY